MGGGNQAILDAFGALSRPIDVFIGHDLDQENRALLMSHKLDLIIDHDLEEDVRRAFSHILMFQKVIPKASLPESKINIVTPYNL